jgi:hypothetical protein
MGIATLGAALASSSFRAANIAGVGGAWIEALNYTRDRSGVKENQSAELDAFPRQHVGGRVGIGE